MKYIVLCRQGYNIKVPCNYNINGICSVDSKKCELKLIEMGVQE